jgi:hypothetical protein
MNVVAAQDATVVTITPSVDIDSDGGVAAALAGQATSLTLNAGQQLQITQPGDLSGSLIVTSKPVGLMAGHECMNVPTNTTDCDHGEQMVPPISALGARHAAVMYRPRVPTETSTFWRVVGVVDNTELTSSTEVGGPASLSGGQSVTFRTGTPFVVSSQDDAHPFMLFTYMTGADEVGGKTGGPDFVLSVPTEQYLYHYVFFSEPVYPETNVVVVRQLGSDAQFHDVVLDCAGTLHGWQPLANDLEYTRLDLSTGSFYPVDACSTGVHEIHSEAPFEITVWGWGTAMTGTCCASYGFPGGMDLKPINSIVL